MKKGEHTEEDVRGWTQRKDGGRREERGKGKLWVDERRGRQSKENGREEGMRVYTCGSCHID